MVSVRSKGNYAADRPGLGVKGGGVCSGEGGGDVVKLKEKATLKKVCFCLSVLESCIN